LAVQAVDPSVTIPYWDFTIESALNVTIFDSIMFTSETFGSLVEPTNATWGWTYRDDPLLTAAIPDGRWAGLQVDMDMYIDLYSNYAYMRSPWNANPSPFISRFSTYITPLPECSSFYELISYDTLTDFLKNAPNGVHSTTHGSIGSVYGCDMLDELREAGIISDEATQIALCQKWGFYMKELYRANMISARGDCSYEDTNPQDHIIDEIDCGYVCSSDSQTLRIMDLKIKDLLNNKLGSLTTAQWDTVRDFICDGNSYLIYQGDHLESGNSLCN
jgi:hypothetical protein